MKIPNKNIMNGPNKLGFALISVTIKIAERLVILFSILAFVIAILWAVGEPL